MKKRKTLGGYYMEKKKMGFWSIVLLTINSIIGTGIFLSPGKVAAIAGTKAPLIYIAAAIFASMLAITFASAAKYVTKSGAAYAYSKAAFGNSAFGFTFLVSIFAKLLGFTFDFACKK